MCFVIGRDVIGMDYTVTETSFPIKARKRVPTVFDRTASTTPPTIIHFFMTLPYQITSKNTTPSAQTRRHHPKNYSGFFLHTLHQTPPHTNPENTTY